MQFIGQTSLLRVISSWVRASVTQWRFLMKWFPIGGRVRVVFNGMKQRYDLYTAGCIE